MKKKILCLIIVIITLAITILPAAAELDIANTENMAYLSPIIYILKANGFTVNTKTPFETNTAGKITFEGDIEVGKVYQSIMTINDFIKEYQPDKYWAGLITAGVNLWANDQKIELNTSPAKTIKAPANATLGISFDQKTITEISYIIIAASYEGQDIYFNNYQENWPHSQDYNTGYIYANQDEGTDSTNKFSKSNIFSKAKIRIDLYMTPISGGETIGPASYTIKNPQYLLGGIWFSNFANICEEIELEGKYNVDYAEIHFDYSEYPYDYNTTPIYISGTSEVDDLNITDTNGNSLLVNAGAVSENYRKFELPAEKTKTPFIVKNYYIYVGRPTDNLKEFTLYSGSELWNAGYVAGQNYGYKQGYTEGEKTASKIQYSAGYAKGVESAKTNHWYNLFFAVVDAPVNVMSSMLNFEIFGVNIKNFLFGLFSICLVIVIIKKVVL